MLKGAENISMYNNIKNKSKLVMTYHMLKLLGHELRCCNWTFEKKKLFWGASCLAYFGSFRMGEILASEKEGSFENLKWSDVKFRDDNSILLNIRFPKINKKARGEFADIFPIPDKNYCPVEALKILAKTNPSPNKAVFSYKNGLCLTTSDFTKDLKKLLANKIGPAVANLSGHSFRAGIPAALCNHPEIATLDDVMLWGRWSSDSYKAYTKLKRTARKTIFDKMLIAIV